MARIDKASWRSEYGSALDLDVLKARYSPPERFRVTEYCYPAGESITASMRAGKCFVVGGACVYKRIGYEELELSDGDFVELPEGTYQLTVADDGDVRILFVWELPAWLGT